MKHYLLTVALVTVVFLAGCSGFTPDEPTVETTPSRDVEYPPGITGDEIADSFTLSDTHTNSLQETSFSVSQTSEIRYTNGTLYTRENQSTHVAVDKTRFRYRSTVDGTAPRFLGGTSGTVELYSNGSVVVRKLDARGNVSYGLVTDPKGEPADPLSTYRGMPLQNSRIPILFGQIGNVSVTPQANGTHLVEATSFSSNTLEVRGTVVRNITAIDFSATVTADGLVREYRLSLQGTVNGQPVTVIEHVRYASVGTTSVTEPAWFDQATNQSTLQKLGTVNR